MHPDGKVDYIMPHHLILSSVSMYIYNIFIYNVFIKPYANYGNQKLGMRRYYSSTYFVKLQRALKKAFRINDLLKINLNQQVPCKNIRNY